MKDISDVTFLVSDSGLFLPFARRLAEDAKRVIFCNSNKSAFPTMKQGCIGAGFPEIEHVLDFWPLIHEVDCVAIPDIGQAGLQERLAELNIPVWGSRTGDKYELGRERFMQTLGEIGLDVPKFEVVVGLTNLRELLRDSEDVYVKISRWRGDMETYHWRSYKMDEDWLDWLAVSLGPLKNTVRFLVFDAIETELEIGGDTICVDGMWPSLMLNGTEIKDSCYFSSVTKTSEMPSQIQNILTAFGPKLAEVNYRNQISFEVRVKGEKSFFNDATQRASQPGSASQQLLWKNFAEIVWAAANGELIEPEPTAQFSIEAMITTKSSKDCWDVVEIPKELEGRARFSNCCYLDGAYCFPPDESTSGELGWLAALSDTPEGVLEEGKRLCDLLPDGLSASIEHMVDVIKEIDSAKQEGIQLSTEQMPEPATVIEE